VPLIGVKETKWKKKHLAKKGRNKPGRCIFSGQKTAVGEQKENTKSKKMGGEENDRESGGNQKKDN